MKETTYALNSSEFITSKIQSIESGCTLIESPTGSGKTSFVLEHLTKTQKILMLVPLVGQVRQLKSTYASRSDIVFLSGTDKSSTRDIADHQGKHIVATYDIWPHLKSKLKFNSYTLVVDEVHKLYSAGSYRDEALNPLLDALADKTTFVKKLMLTATYTPNLAEIANILPDTWMKITRPTIAAPKKLTVNVYSQQWSYHWLQAVFNRLQQRTGKQIVFVRLNSNARMEKAAECLKTKGYKVLAVSRRTLGNDVVKQVLIEQELPKGYDVVLTTSIFDEAINLNNADSDIDSVHIVDASAHPEEIVQFMGRLRNANPPFFLHIQKDAVFLNPLKSIDETKCWKHIQAQYDTLINFANASKMIAQTFGEQIVMDGLMKGIAAVNTTLSNFLECPILTAKANLVVANKAGILACCYRTDTFYIYQHYDKLAARLKALLPSLVVDKHCCNDKSDSSLDDLMKSVEAAQEASKKQAIKVVCQRIELDRKVDKKSLLEYGYEKLNELKENGQTANPFNRVTQLEAYRQYTPAVTLCTHLEDINDVQRALDCDDTYKVIELSNSYRNDIFKNEIRTILKQRLKLNETKIEAEDAEYIVRTAFTRACQQLPTLKNIILQKPRLGISLQKGNNHVNVNPSKAMNLLVQMADVDDFNAKKSTKRYLMLKGLHWKGYIFCHAKRTPCYEDTKPLEEKLVEESLEAEFA